MENSQLYSQSLPDEERNSMVDMFAHLLREKFDDTRLREALVSEEGFDQVLWHQMAELGLLGLMIDEDCKGMGLGIIEVQAILEQAGKALFTSPYVSSCVIAPALLRRSNEKFAADLLRGICAGDLIIAEAGFDNFPLTEVGSLAVSAELVNDAWQLSGTVDFVQYLHIASKSLVLAQAAGEYAVFMLDLKKDGVSFTSLQANDPSLRLFNLRLNNVVVQRLPNIGVEQIQYALDLAVVAQAGEQVGASREVFDQTIEYLKTRIQFGRPIGSFQALKHVAADLMVEVESITSAARFAARAMQADSAECGSLVGLAGFTCSDGYRRVAAEAIQLHGGIAYTTEHSAHLFWRRAQSCMWLYGSPDRHRERYLFELEAKQ